METKAQRWYRAAHGAHGTLGVMSVTTLLVLAGCMDADIIGPDWSWDGSFGDAWNTGRAAEAGFRYGTAAASRVSLTGLAGSVEIVGRTDATEILVEGIRRVLSHTESDAREHLPELGIDVRESEGTVFIETVQPSLSRGRSYQVDYRVQVPVGTDVTVVQVAGPVEIRSLTGDVETHVTTGSVSLEQLSGDVRATVVSGGMDAVVALPPAGVVDLRSSTGDISLNIPTGTSAALRAVTMSGAVRLVGLVLEDQDPRASVLRATMAAGNGTILLETVLGDITVKGR